MSPGQAVLGCTPHRRRDNTDAAAAGLVLEQRHRGQPRCPLTATVRGHMELIGPEVEAAAGKLPEDDIPRYCALACVGEARGKLRAVPARGAAGAQSHARRLARSLAALCDHYEALTGVTMCLACDKRITPNETSIPYDHVSASGGAAGAGRIHTRCANTVRRH